MQKYIIAVKNTKIKSFFVFSEKNRIPDDDAAETRGEVRNMGRRTDLALEEKELWEESAQDATALSGVRAWEHDEQGVHITEVEVLDGQGAAALHKPVGTYLTLELTALHRRERDGFRGAAEALGRQLRGLLRLDDAACVLVAGLGNAAITPDAVGPKALEHLLITRHLVEQSPAFFQDYRSVAAVAPGVLGITGLESAEVVHGVVEKARPDCMIVVDALASRSLARICTTVQLADTGITPGSGIHNAREAFDQARFGIPVVAVGVPTVVDVETLLQDFGRPGGPETEELTAGRQMIVTPRDIDARVEQIAKLVAYGINLAVHQGLSVDDIAYLVE